MSVTPYRLDIPDVVLADLLERLARTRRSPVHVADDWSRGIPPTVLDAVLAHWGGPYDWRVHEARLNGFEHVLVETSVLPVHVLKAGTPGATPLLLVHGWPDGFVRFEKALPLLADRFELLVPSIPGFAFSGKPTATMGPIGTADLFAEVMTALGHERFGVHGADLGSQIGEQLGQRHAERLLGLHLGDIPVRRVREMSFAPPADLTNAERDWIARLHAWDLGESAYAREQRTKPQTIGAALDDSPAALAAWIVEKFHTWSEGDVLDVYTLDELCTNLTIYWATVSGMSAAQYYYDGGHATLAPDPVTVPSGFALFPADLLPGPRESAERWFDVVRWTEMPHGGHFGPWEQPEAWAAEVRAFFDQLEGSRA